MDIQKRTAGHYRYGDYGSFYYMVNCIYTPAMHHNKLFKGAF
jgi:hypothetical protein